MVQLVAGVDCSTQATKVVVVDAETGEIRAIGREDHTVTGGRGARESDPREWWSALRSALAQTGLAGEIAALAVAGQQHGLVTLDAKGGPVRAAMLWNDTRPGGIADALVQSLGATRWAVEVGSVPTAAFTVAKWAWLRQNEPTAAAATKAIRLPHDYVTERLTGSAVTDRGDASGTAWWSLARGTYAEEVLALETVDLDSSQLPTVLGPHEPAGKVRRVAAADLGLKAGTLVGPGTGDNMAAGLGLALKPGQPVVSLGTSGTVYMVSERRPADASGTVAGFADAAGRFLPLACTLNCTVAIDQVALWLGLDREDVAPADDVVVLPYFDGERVPNLPGATATITGVRHSTNPRQILQASYEGAAAALVEALDIVAEQSGDATRDAPLILIGGGARGRAWRDVVGRLSGRQLQVPHAAELVALGAAAQAADVLTGESATTIASRWQAAKGAVIDAVPRDIERLARIRHVREAAIASGLLSAPSG